MPTVPIRNLSKYTWIKLLPVLFAQYDVKARADYMHGMPTRYVLPWPSQFGRKLFRWLKSFRWKRWRITMPSWNLLPQWNE